MTNTNIVGLLLSILCLGLYFQFSIDELRTLMINQREAIVVQKKEIAEQRNEILKQATKQEETIEQLKERLYEQRKKLDKLSLQVQLRSKVVYRIAG